jgi:hypothetical protein
LRCWASATLLFGALLLLEAMLLAALFVCSVRGCFGAAACFCFWPLLLRCCFWPSCFWAFLLLCFRALALLRPLRIAVTALFVATTFAAHAGHRVRAGRAAGRGALRAADGVPPADAWSGPARGPEHRTGASANR